ncbi:MAG: Gfo/Idh/MocA family oxidoreductase [Desulfobulbus sp.]|uniref:Gfo/Idh/MocA family protein n=1 Tax=Desulfobulbus sp. TaxID=895 RepID=UPI002845BB17|nr:Gfo/Idh/MocA family oxidoreductase [Desulfobulbus sp.]MDR2550586.1 Gfo/Idh/MocA family oxidoreductase [Desulfobulbus sp.]
MQPTNDRWRVGVIGTGKHGSRYARHIVQDIEGLELAAVSRRSEEGRDQAGQWGCSWHADWCALVADPAVDCVISALPPTLNLQVAAACAEAQKPLLLEKPMAVSVAEARAIEELFARNRVGLTIGQTLRYNRVLDYLRGQLADIGHLYGFTANQRLEPATLAWLDEPSAAGAGVTFHSAVHVFDALRWITGQEIVRVMAKTRCMHSQRLEDHLIALVELTNGVIGTVDCSKIGPARSGRFEFIGSLGQLHADQVHHVGESIRGQGRLVLEMGEPLSTIVPFLRDWLAFLRGIRPNPIPGSEGVAAVRVCEACLRSAAKGGWVTV